VIKVIRNNETMLKAGMKELECLKSIAAADPENRRHCIRLVSWFEHRNHLCMVFEPMNMNLREVLRKVGGEGLSLAAVRSFAKQLFIGLKLLKKVGVIHADLKPDNILVNENYSVVKICDFGSAMGPKEDREITPVLVSRFYRAPEIMLGLQYDDAIDIWAVGCILFELFTGKFMFPGNDNNEMLKLQQEMKGALPKKEIRKGRFSGEHFDANLVFELQKHDPIDNKVVKQKIQFGGPTKDLAAILQNACRKSEDRKKVLQLADLIHKCCTLDPQQRIKVDDALHHPFVKES